MRKTYITKNNALSYTDQFTLLNLITERIYNKRGYWEDVQISASFKHEALKSITQLIGGRGTTKEKVMFVLENNPIDNWFTERFVLQENGWWSYIGSQDYTGEMKLIRHQLVNKYS